MFNARIFSEDDVTYKNFASREEIEKYFKEYFFLYRAEIKERGNLLPIGGKRSCDSYIEWYDE